VELRAELEGIAAAAAELAGPEEELESVIPTEPEPGTRIYLCSYAGPLRTWAAVDGDGTLVAERSRIRAAVSIAALCEFAEGIEEAEEAALALERAIESPPRLASPAYLDAVGMAVRQLEIALGESMSSPFAETMKHASAVVEELELEVEAGYKGDLT
jgi:hypothetical protein